MGLIEAEAGMLKLESATAAFDYEKADYYRSKAAIFFERKVTLYPHQPELFDPTKGRTSLPSNLEQRIEKWMPEHPEYSNFMRTFARNYLLSLLDEECDDELYGLLADCVMEGADFYLESGMLYFRDAVAVPTLC